MVAYRFYGELAGWWPLVSPVDDYRSEAAEIARLIAEAGDSVREVLELGSGGGHLANHLTARFAMTLTDLSPDMLAMSQLLNPECPHHLGDMRTLRLGRTFDAVLIHDAIDYLLTEPDLRAAFATAAAHLGDGGVLVVCPDHTAEIFEPSTDWGGSDAPDGRGVRFLDWCEAGEGTTRTTHYSFVFRHADGGVEHAAETHVTGLFPEATWLRLFAETGFAATAVTEQTDEDRTARTIFVARRQPSVSCEV